MTSKATTVARFLAEQPVEKRKVLAGLRRVVRGTLRGAKESMEYGMPCYTVAGEIFCGFNAQKNYFAFYLCGSNVVARNKKLLKGANVGRGCIRFKQAEQLPEKTLRLLLREARQSLKTH